METIQWAWANHSGLILSAVALLAAWWWGKDKVTAFLETVHSILDKIEKQYRHAKDVAKANHIYEKAELAYEFIANQSRKTESTLDDKAANGLKKALELLKKAGWGPEEIGEDEKDIILAYFNKFHEAEHRLLEASKGVPVSNKAAAAGEIAAPLAPSSPQTGSGA